MYIGNLIKERMGFYNININKLSDESFINLGILQDIINNKISLKNIDEFDLNMISSVLYCTTEYFINEEIRNNDLVYMLNCNCNEKFGNDLNIKNKMLIGKIQNFCKDFIFCNNILDCKNNYKE